MKYVSKWLLLSLAFFIAAPIIAAAADKKEAVVEPKKEAKTEADVLKELEKFNATELALLKAIIKRKGEIYSEGGYFKVEKDVNGIVATARVFGRVHKVSMDEDISVLAEVAEVNEPLEKLNAYFRANRVLGFLWESEAISFASQSTRCERKSYGHKYVCTSRLSNELYAFLDKKLKENPKFLDDRINKQ